MKFLDWLCGKPCDEGESAASVMARLHEHDARTAEEQRHIRESLARIEVEVQLLTREAERDPEEDDVR